MHIRAIDVVKRVGVPREAKKSQSGGRHLSAEFVLAGLFCCGSGNIINMVRGRTFRRASRSKLIQRAQLLGLDPGSWGSTARSRRVSPVENTEVTRNGKLSTLLQEYENEKSYEAH